MDHLIPWPMGCAPNHYPPEKESLGARPAWPWKPAPSGNPEGVPLETPEEGLHVHQEPWAEAAPPEYVTLDATVVLVLTNNQYFNSSLHTGKSRHHLSLFDSTISIL